MDFLWHKTSKDEREKIKKDAKKMMDSFSKKISRISEKKSIKDLTERERKDKKEDGCKTDLQKRILENAKQKTNHSIVAEKKKW